MSPVVLLSADQLHAEQACRIGVACAGWAEFRHIPQTLPVADTVTHLAQADVLVGWTGATLLPGSSITTYLCGSAGIDAYVGLGLEQKPGFRLTNAAGVMSRPIAEHCLALMFALMRQLPEILDQQRRRHYERRWHGGEVGGSTACIVGLGGSGTMLAGLCRGLGLRTIGVARTPTRHAGITDELYALPDLATAVSGADHVFALLPGGTATRHVFNEGIFSAMKPGARFYSASRGSVTDEIALIGALAGGHLSGAGLDVFAQEPLPAASPLWGLPQVIVSPHSAGLSDQLNGRLTDLFIDNLQRLRDGRPLRNEIALSALT